MIEILLEDNLGILEKVQALLEYRKVILEHLKLNEHFSNYKKKILKLKLTHSGSIQYSVVIKKGENFMKGIIYTQQQFAQLHLHTK